MKPSFRGPVLLAFAGVFMLAAIVAYLVGDADSNCQRHEAIIRDQGILGVQNERSLADRAALHEQTTRLSTTQTELARQNVVTLQLLRRVDELTKQVIAQNGRFEKSESSPREHADHK